ncbi:hypothetical protein [Pseudoxanthomonas kalamensis]|uniref:hypothetical protein n=1 Tax=Pseudoxanthomonas kalamensis TaxID=289483 RepID=UPI00139164E0|nr:hypothetical protein [Pseudoxanthomonas kalamensis]
MSSIANKCAEFISRPRAVPMAVCVDPALRVTVGEYDDSVPSDVIGVYNKTIGRMELWRQIEADLRCEYELRIGGLGRVA